MEGGWQGPKQCLADEHAGVRDLCQPQELGVTLSGLHGQPAVCVCKRGHFCLEEKNALGQDPELQWLHAHTSTVTAFPASLAAFGYHLSAWLTEVLGQSFL